MRQLRPVTDLVLPKVNETIGALDLVDQDVAAARLARRYAAAIDEAAVIASELAEVAKEPDASAWHRVRALAAKVEQQEVLAKLGPKLLDALESLGATPRARGAKGGVSVPAGRGGLAAIRSSRSA